jgi:uncharacterized membrane protein
MAENSTRQVVAGLVGAVIYGLLSWFANTHPLPEVGGVIFHPAVAFLVFFGMAYGPWAGLLAGLVGNTLGDLLSIGNFYWNWSLGHALMGMIPGFMMIKLKDFGTVLGIVRAIGWSALGIAAGTLFACLMEIFVSGIDLRTALVDYFPFAFLGYFLCALILLPILMIVFAAVVSRPAR